MAFSMFFRNQVCQSRFISQHLIKMASQPPLSHTRLLSTRTIFQQPEKNYNEVRLTPMLNPMRAFRTSPVGLSSEKPHDHAKLWIVEKAVSAAIVPLIPIALLMPNKILDCALAILITAHSFWGLEAIAVDYVRASVFGAVIAKAAIALVYLISIATLGGMFYIIGHDVGIANSIRQLWAIKTTENKS